MTSFGSRGGIWGATEQQVLISTPGNLGRSIMKTGSSKVLGNYNPTEKN